MFTSLRKETYEILRKETDEFLRKETDKVGYYWYKSTGEIPPNAIQGGIDQDGGKIYLGRAYHEEDHLPAKVIKNHKTAYVCHGGKEYGKNEFEVLCEDGCKVIWQESKNGNVPKGAVIVGETKGTAESNRENLYIGRVSHDDTLTPGKIHPSHGCLYLPYRGKEIKFWTYEALVLENNEV